MDITNSPAPVHDVALFLRRWVVNAFGFRTNYHNEANLSSLPMPTASDSQVLKSQWLIGFSVLELGRTKYRLPK